jgi:hypothetical protein
MSPKLWKPGDRVALTLPTGQRHRPNRQRVTGSVRAVDEPGLPSGVRVDLDAAVRGVTDCYATHDELVSEYRSLGPMVITPERQAALNRMSASQALKEPQQ